jgi:D-inositol-3-phosphate glycosyltransferase
VRVALVSEHASPLATLGGVDAGGQNVHVAALAQHLARQGLEVDVYTRRDDRSSPAQVPLGPRVTVLHVDAGPPEPLPKDDLLPYMDEFAAWLVAAWSMRPPRLVHAHFWMSGRAALAAGRVLSIPVVQTFHALGVVKRRHQGDRDTSPPSRLDEEVRLASDVDHIVATCSDEVFELIRLGADARRITVVPCGVDTQLFSHTGARVPRRAGSARVLMAGRLVERKGISDVIDALPALPNAELLVAGGPPSSELRDDPEACRLLASARARRVPNRVRLLGQVDHDRLPALMRSADVVACTPWYEPFGIVPLEAMACGVPVVASAVGGLVDTVVDGVTGIQVPPRRPDAIARALEVLLTDPNRRAAMGRAGAKRARARYTWDRVAASTHEVYRRVLAVHARSHRLAPSTRTVER